ncbi:membrane protein [Enterococcus florum]|uniref:Membrane protein n=1 Tax=Enterococcus florum TaxID=2480627 RepID=A0A4P5PAZ8_9ENTE|nr:cytosine permease [Enterococcus florum]GCF95297.1 membrane protein [Enterococcus florum]
MEKNYYALAREIPVEDRPISNKRLSGLGNFFGLYGGEHIAATEFVIGATLVTWGVSATNILLGLLVGNLLATLTYALLCAPIAVDTRLTLYSYLKKVLGPYMQKVYNFIWGIASIAMAASMLTVSASAVREIFNVPLQTKWYPTSVTFVIIVIVLGIIVTVVAANGFDAVAKFASVSAPWMILVFFVGALLSIPTLLQSAGVASIHSFGDFMTIMNTTVWTGTPLPGNPQLGLPHVIAFSWMCNLAYHGGLNDMSLFRYARKSTYGYVSAVGMYIGHFFAWGCAGIMGAAAALMLGKSLLVLDSGAVTNAVVGGMGLLAVIFAGWTTANPSIYRAGLAFQTIFDLDLKKLTYLVGGVMTVVACLPITANVMTIVNIIVLVVPSIGAIAITEHWILPKFGATRYWSMYRKEKVNRAALISWLISLAFVVVMTISQALHSYFLFLPTYLLAMGSYVFLALAMGAKEDYSAEVLEESRIQSALQELIEEEEKDVLDNRQTKVPKLARILQGSSFVFLGIILLVTVASLTDMIDNQSFRTISMILTLLYFVCGATGMYVRERAQENEAAAQVEEQL